MAKARRYLIASALSTVALLSSSAALAEIPRPFGETTGVVIEGSFGVNGITDDDYVDDIWLGNVDAGAMVGLGLNLAYRPIDYLSIGLLTHYAFLNGDGENMSGEFAGFLSVLAEVRGHLPLGRVDPFIGFGFGYAMTHYKAEDLGHIDGSLARLALHGVGLDVSAGLNVFLTQNFSLGLFFRMVFGVYVTACWQYEDVPLFGDDDDCDDIEDLYNVDDRDDLPDMPHLWVVGIDASYII